MSDETDYARLEDRLKDASAQLSRVWLWLEYVDAHLPVSSLSTAAPQEKIRQAQKMVNSLRAALDREKGKDRA